MVAGKFSVAKIWLSVLAAVTTVSCGGTSNFNKVFGDKEESASGKLAAAQIAYDRGDFTKAADLASELLAKNGFNENAAILLAYVRLSQAGVDPFVLARKLIAINTSSSSTAATGAPSALLNELDLSPSTAEYRDNLADEYQSLAPAPAPTSNGGGQTSATTSGGASSSGMASVLVKLQDVISPSENDEPKLYSRQFSTSDVGTSPASLLLFGDSNKLMLPNEVDSTLRSNIDILNYLDQALAAVCSFVDTDIITAEGQRGASTTCTQTTYGRKQAIRAHFVWALSHLAEAVVFQKAILYVPDGKTSTSIDSATTQMAATSSTDLTAVINATAEIIAATTKVFDVTNSKSMTQVTLADLQMVTLAFDKIANLPTSIKTAITGAFTQLTSVSKQANGGVTTANNAKAFKTQITTSLSKSLATKIQSAATSGKASAEQVTQLCTSYSQLTSDATADSAVVQAKPAACTN